MPCFVHRRVVVEKVQRIGLRIHKFSQVESSGRYSSTVLQSETSDWALEVQACGDSVQIYLRRESSSGGEQFVEVQLTVDDRMGSPFGRRSGWKSLSFKGPTDFRNVMSFQLSALNRWWFVPQDTLTIRGNLTVYREVEEVLGSEEQFQSWSEKVWKVVRILGLVCAIAGGYFTKPIAVQFVSSVILPALVYVIEVFCLIMIAAAIVYNVVEDYLNPRTKIPKGSAKSREVQGCPNDRAMVPTRNGSAVRVDSPAGHSRFRQNRRMGAYDPKTRRYYEYEESYSY